MRKKDKMCDCVYGKLTRWHFFLFVLTCLKWDIQQQQIDPPTSERECKRLRDMLQLSYIEPFYSPIEENKVPSRGEKRSDNEG